MSNRTSYQKSESILGLPDDIGSGGLGNSLVPYNPQNQAVTRDEKRIGEEYRKQIIVIEAQAAKTIFGQTKIAEINRHAAQVFDDTVGFIVTTKAEARGKEHQAYIDEFANRQIQMFARHMFGTLEVGATKIGLEIDRTLYVEASRRRLLARLFGSD